MAAQRGKDLLLKIEGDMPSSFVTIAGLRTRKLSFNSQTVDVTDTESSGRWRELLSGSGVRNASLSASGIFKDKVSDERVRQVFFDGLITQWQIVIPVFGIIEGLFQISALEYAGNHDGEVTFDIAMESAGPIIFLSEVTELLDDDEVPNVIADGVVE